MKWVYHHIFKLLWSRPARNILFWLVMVYIVLNNDVQSRIYPVHVYYTGIALTTSILIIYTYLNNLWLMPAYVRTKKYGGYAWRAIVITIFISLAFVLGVKLMMTSYPKLTIHHISLFSTPVNTDWSLVAIWEEVVWCLGGLGLWLFIMSTAWYMNDYVRQQKLLETAQRKQTETELHFLKNQVNPHFLFNTLNNLYGLALKKADTAPDAILRLSSILRYMLYESNSERVSFEKEKEIMQAYINLELLRLPAGTDVKVNITNDRDYLVPPLLWLSVLENVFKHGTRMIADSYKIVFDMQIADNKLLIRSRNNYKASDNGAKTGGIGLDNLRKRLDLLYPGKYDISAAAEDDIYAVTVRIDL